MIMKSKIILFITLSFLSCNNKNSSNEYIDMTFKSWKSETEKALELSSEIDDLARENMIILLQDITAEDFDKLKNELKVNEYNEEYFLLQIYEGEIVTDELFYVVRKHNKYYCACLRIEHGKKIFKNNQFTSDIKLNELINKKIKPELDGGDIILTYKIGGAISSKYLTLNKEVLDFIENMI